MEEITIKTEPIDVESVDIPQEMSRFLDGQTAEESMNDSTCGSIEENALPFENIDGRGIKEEILDSPPEPNFDDIGEFCFESDHLALKSNSDYKVLLEAIVILETQRAQAIKDLDQLLKCQKEALDDPIRFVEQLQKKEKLNIPAPQKVYQLPAIDWCKYALSGNQSGFGRRQVSRFSSKAHLDLGQSSQSEDIKPKSNQYWTAEEQKKLEELLVQFPPEEVEARRWQKIANCLENRTPIQVASRVQKYFIKLMKAGMPIPGRMPSTAYLKKPRRNVIRQNPSTFLVSTQPTVYMPDADEDFSSSATSFAHSQPQSYDETSCESKVNLSDSDGDEFDISNSSLYNTPEFEELRLLQRIKKEKLKSSSISHIGYKCGRCKVEPITGVRWHCTVCKPESIDFCSQCFESEFEIGQHTVEHKLESIQHATTAFLDRDYMHFLGGSDYNYLDPNYMPAS